MPNTKKAAGAETAAQGGASARKYTARQLAAGCRQLFGVSASTFAGAAYGMTGTYTVEEMKAHIEAWKKKGMR